MGDYERYKADKDKETELFMDVVPPIISRAMWEEAQKQKEKNQRSYCRNRVYIFFQKLICPTCGKIMTCKGAGGKKAKYMYYYCDTCNVYYNEDDIEYCIRDFIFELVEYDMSVKKYFYPILAEKNDTEINEINSEIEKLEKKKSRLINAYMDEIIQENDFSTEYKIIEEKISTLEAKKMESLEIDDNKFNPQHLMAERDIERKILIEDDKYRNYLREEWEKKSKEEKQEFISKFIESMTLSKDKNGNYQIDNINFRHSYIEQLVKFFDCGIYDRYIWIDSNGEEKKYRVSVNLEQKQLDDYLEKMREKFEIKYYHAFDMDLNKKENKDYELNINSTEKVIRFVGVKTNKKFKGKKENIIKLGMIIRVKKNRRIFCRKNKI